MSHFLYVDGDFTPRMSDQQWFHRLEKGRRYPVIDVQFDGDLIVEVNGEKITIGKDEVLGFCTLEEAVENVEEAPPGLFPHLAIQDVQFTICDMNPHVVKACAAEFADLRNFTVKQGDILELEGDVIISPANSFGYMDGGIDLAYRNRFGMKIQEQLQNHIFPEGELPVGQACILETQDDKIRSMICAPTMRVPEDVSDTVNAYLAFRAAVQLVKYLNDELPVHEPIKSVLTPGMCTLTGRMPPARAARQMKLAYLSVGWRVRQNMDQIKTNHLLMKSHSSNLS
jgi:O-acetyl-ADP-ribose deacetylase (regulator of RNase III)